MNNATENGNSFDERNIKSATDPIAAVKTWLDVMAKRGMYGPESARLRATAITQLTSVLGPEESRDPASIVRNIDDIGKRYARLKNGKPDTVSTYVSRAKLTLQDFITYQEDPTKFKGSAVGGRSTTKPQAKKPPSANAGVAKASDDMQVAETAGQPSDGPQSSSAAYALPPKTEGARPEMRSFPLGKDGRKILYALPTEGFTMRDVYKFIVHVATMAEDFDPFDRQQSAVLAMVKTQE